MEGLLLYRALLKSLKFIPRKLEQQARLAEARYFFQSFRKEENKHELKMLFEMGWECAAKVRKGERLPALQPDLQNRKKIYKMASRRAKFGITVHDW